MVTTNDAFAVRKASYAGLFLVALATLMYEILLTRIFSVTMWYHFSFVAISVAMFGMTVGALLVYLARNFFTQERAKTHLSASALLFALTMILSFLTHLCIPFVIDRSLVGFYSLTLTYIIISIPFIFSGICVSLALTKFPRQVSKLYAADLIGAALGCILLVYALRLTDGPTAVIVVSVLAGLGSLFFALDARSRQWIRRALISSLLLAFFAAVQMLFVHKGFPLIRLMWVKGVHESRPLYEKWNSFSRIRVWGDPSKQVRPSGWGMSSAFRPEMTIRQLHMNIDAFAYTPILEYDGDLRKIDFLRYDVTNIVHYLRRDSDMLVIGPGGGRDILSALLFGQRSVLGVEINRIILDTVNDRFAAFTGFLDRDPRVTFVNDEARSYVARQQKTFDIIQSSLIDSYAATAAGAFVLTENSLYTIEAWKSFLEHLSPRGILTFSRWYWESPSECYRLTSLAAASLRQLGIDDPAAHIVIVRQLSGRDVDVGTILVSRSPFTSEDLDTVEAVAKRLRFELPFTPRAAIDSTYALVVSQENSKDFASRFPINIAPPTDDSPFFFHMLRIRDALNPGFWMREFKRGRLDQWDRENSGINTKPILILGTLLLTVILLTLLCIIVPLSLTTKRSELRGSVSLFLFFAGIGLGFMLVEISQMQRMIIFLGHPTYGLSVVLFALLLSSGLGSYSTRRLHNPGKTHDATVRLAVLIVVLVIFGILTPHAMDMFHRSGNAIRISVATVILLPLGFFMGMAFPLGMHAAAAKAPSIIPWLWGLNGATSVCASVLAVAIALGSGISTAFWAGLLCYGLAAVSLVTASRGTGPRRSL